MNYNKTYRLTVSKDNPAVVTHLSSAPNKTAYIKALILRDMARNGFDVEIPDEALHFDDDYKDKCKSISVTVQLNKNTDANMISWIASQSESATSYMRGLVCEDVLGEDWRTFEALTKEQLARRRAECHKRFNVTITVYQRGSAMAVRQLGYQSNLCGYIKSLIRNDMGLEAEPIYADHLSQRNFNRFMSFGDEELLGRWQIYKDKETAIKDRIQELEELALSAEEDSAEYRQLRESVKQFKEVQRRIEDKDYDTDADLEELQNELEKIREFQHATKMKAMLTTGSDRFNEWKTLRNEQADLRERLEAFNKKLNNRGVKRIHLSLDVSDARMYQWLVNKDFCDNTKLNGYDYWLRARRNYRDADGEDSWYKRQPGEAIGFYVTQLICADVTKNGYGDRSVSRAGSKNS